MSAPPSFRPGDLVSPVKDLRPRTDQPNWPVLRRGDVFVVVRVFPARSHPGCWAVSLRGCPAAVNAHWLRKVETKPRAFWAGEKQPVDA